MFSQEEVDNIRHKVMQLSFRWSGSGFGHPPETWWPMELKELDHWYKFLHAEMDKEAAAKRGGG